ncbi:MAG TPA: NAD(P)-dependent oxidoreductase [Tepidisphaeraceae bacterium]|jgi:nucleoside-diphosphate-sugar epimerase
MKILFTGASSFTGFWFIRELASQGHAVIAILRKAPEEYPDDVRRVRARLLKDSAKRIETCTFGDERFMALLDEGGWDVLCHHAADVTNYKSPDFNVTAAVENNTRNLSAVLGKLKTSGCRRVVVTGSVFENDEGAGSGGLNAFSPYGLSKALTWQMFRYYSDRAGIGLGKFVIPNPFGPYEEPRFTAYLMKNWFAGKCAAVNTPVYVRDNIHVSLLAKCYGQFLAVTPQSGISKMGPCGYVESQGAFTLRLASEMRKRLGLACEVELKQQTDFSEPHMRINTDIPAIAEWDETASWDEFARYYSSILKSGGN